jgi:hypothetical protein
MPVYVVTNHNSGEHVYTTDPYEYKNVKKTWKGKHGIVYYVGMVNPVIFGVSEYTGVDERYIIYGTNFNPQEEKPKVEDFDGVTGKKYKVDIINWTNSKIIYQMSKLTTSGFITGGNGAREALVSIETVNGKCTGHKNPPEDEFANWKVGKYSVTYHSNFPQETNTSNAMNNFKCFLYENQFCDSVISEIVQAEDGKRNGFEEIINFKLPFGSKYRYEIVSWNTRADGKGRKYPDRSLVIKQTKNITIYAQWKKVSN